MGLATRLEQGSNLCVVVTWSYDTPQQARALAYSTAAANTTQVIEHTHMCIRSHLTLPLATLPQIHAEVREAAAGAGPGLFASQDIKQGNAILSVPVDQGFSALGGVNGVLVSTPWLRFPKSESGNDGVGGCLMQKLLTHTGSVTCAKLQSECLVASSSTDVRSAVPSCAHSVRTSC